eukprot:3092226-Prymnesium_polylepis.1
MMRAKTRERLGRGPGNAPARETREAGPGWARDPSAYRSTDVCDAACASARVGWEGRRRAGCTCSSPKRCVVCAVLGHRSVSDALRYGELDTSLCAATDPSHTHSVTQPWIT